MASTDTVSPISRVLSLLFASFIQFIHSYFKFPVFVNVSIRVRSRCGAYSVIRRQRK